MFNSFCREVKKNKLGIKKPSKRFAGKFFSILEKSKGANFGSFERRGLSLTNCGQIGQHFYYNFILFFAYEVFRVCGKRSPPPKKKTHQKNHSTHFLQESTPPPNFAQSGIFFPRLFNTVEVFGKNNV